VSPRHICDNDVEVVEGSYDSDPKYRGGDDSRTSVERCRWISMQTVAPLYRKCAISQSQTMKSQRSISNELHYNAKIDLIAILKKNAYYFL